MQHAGYCAVSTDTLLQTTGTECYIGAGLSQSDKQAAKVDLPHTSDVRYQVTQCSGCQQTHTKSTPNTFTQQHSVRLPCPIQTCCMHGAPYNTAQSNDSTSIQT